MSNINKVNNVNNATNYPQTLAREYADILIIGAGPAGLAAAASAAVSTLESSVNHPLQIHIVDDNFFSGGQIWRGGANQQKDQRAQHLWDYLTGSTHVTFHFQSKVVLAQNIDQNQIKIIVESKGQSRIFIAKKLIIATGARELLLPFPGWTLPQVTGAGGLQALTKNGFPIAGKRVVVAGTGPLLLAVADSLLQRGAIVTHIIEQTRLSQLARFSLHLLAAPKKLLQAISLFKNCRKIAYLSNAYVTAAHGESSLQNISVWHQGKLHHIECDYLACGYGLIPNIELATSLLCKIDDDGTTQTVRVDNQQKTSQENIYCAGEGTGIGGVDLALAEGSIAGYFAASAACSASASDASNSTSISAKKLVSDFKLRKNGRRFSALLQSTFALRPELRQLCRADTIVCRCEDVSFQALQQHADWRSAKLHTRCGMGACQGNICGAANRFLFSWTKDHGRLPLNNASIASLMMLEETEKTDT